MRLVEAPAKAERQFAGESNDLIPEEPELKDWIDNMPIAMSKSLARQILLSQTKEPEPLPEQPPPLERQPATFPVLSADEFGSLFNEYISSRKSQGRDSRLAMYRTWLAT